MAIKQLSYNQEWEVSRTVSNEISSLSNLLHYDNKELQAYKKELDSIQTQFKNKAISIEEAKSKIAKARDEQTEKIYKRIADTVNKQVDKQAAHLKEEREFAKASHEEQIQLILKKEKQLKDEKIAIKDRKAAIEEELKNAVEGSNEQKALLEALKKENEKQEQNKKDQKDLQKQQREVGHEELKNRRELVKLEKDLQTRKEKLSEKQKAQDLERQRREVEADEARQRLIDGEGQKGDFGKLFQKGTDFSSLADPSAWLDKGFKLLLDGIHALGDKFDNAFSSAEEVLNTYQAKISTRLEGSGREYKSISEVLRKNLSLSGIIEQKRVLENVGKLVEQGIAYDLEQRAFLATVSEEISSTFDAFDSNLLRIIRIQREDSTYARMGLETSLSRLFNEYFLDSSYLNDMYDSVSAALIDATSQLSTAQSAEFEYTVQKWLGALYSMGASQSFVSQVATGLNMLGTGNVEGLAGSPMQTLFAMAANRSSTDYASLLTGGLTKDNTNALLKSMVEYLAEISGNTRSNRVVAGAYSNLFNMTLSDMRAVQNLSNDIDSIFTEDISYSQMAGVTNQRITTLGSNYSLGKRVSTLFNNILFSSAQSLVENPATYVLYKAMDIVGKVGDAVIPTVSVLGNSINLGGTITDLVKSGIFGVSMIGNIISGLGHLGENNELYSWTTQGEMRGSGYDLTSRSSISQSYTGNASSADMEYQTLDAASKDAKSKAKTINGQEESESEITLDVLYYGLFDNTNKEGAVSAMNRNISTVNTLLNSSYSADFQAQRVVISGINFGTGELEIPVKFSSNGEKQVASQLTSLVNAIAGADGVTLSMLLMLIASALNEENGAVNVNLQSSSMPLPKFITGESSPDSTGTRTLPSGNGATSPRVASAGSIMKDLSRNTMLAI